MRDDREPSEEWKVGVNRGNVLWRPHTGEFISILSTSRKKHTTRLNAPNTKERAQEGEVEGEVKSLRRPLQPALATCDYFMREKSILGHLMV